MKNRLTLLGMFGLLLACGIAPADTRFVAPPPAGSDSNGGTGWGDAWATISNAVARSTADSTILVADGTYSIGAPIVIDKALSVLGFSGDPDDVIVDAGFAPGGAATNRCLQITAPGAVVAGMTFQNGADIGTGAGDGGGGVRMTGGVLSNCVVRRCTVFNTAHDSGGGGVRVAAGRLLACRITDNLVTNIAVVNFRGNGGGVLAESGSTVADSTIERNGVHGGHIDGAGGGVWLNASGIRSCVIRGNTNVVARYGGGIAMSGSDSVMNACTVTLNRATYGGGCRMYGGTTTNCLIVANDAQYHGPGIYLWNTAGVPCFLLNSRIVDNRNGGYGAVTTDSRAGGFNVVRNCTIEDNDGHGIQVYQSGDNNFFENCRVTHNGASGVIFYHTSTSGSGRGHVRNCLVAHNGNYGIYFEDDCTFARVSGCTITGNKNTGVKFDIDDNYDILVLSSIIHGNGLSGLDDVGDANAPLNYGKVQYSCVGSDPGLTGPANIVADPRFRLAASGDYSIRGDSPCVNGGLNETWMIDTLDLAGNPRIRYETVDMGAYESQVPEGTVEVSEFHVVPSNANAAAPYGSWATAGTNINDVIGTALTYPAPRIIWMTNGTYALDEPITIGAALMLRGIEGSGPTDVIVDGGFVPGGAVTNRCLLITDPGALVCGLTFSNGAFLAKTTGDGGGGVRMTGGVLSNCVVRNCTLFHTASYAGGGGVNMNAGTLVECRVTDNLVTNIGALAGYGGGVYAKAGSTLAGCTIGNNMLVSGGINGSGGGVYLDSSEIRASVINGNTNIVARYGGGVLMIGNDSIMNGCTVTLNRAEYGGGCKLGSGTITNCLFSGNYCGYWGPGVFMENSGATTVSRLIDSVVVSNQTYVTWGAGAVTLDSANGGTCLVDRCFITDSVGYGVNFFRQPGENNFVLNSEISRNSAGGIGFNRGGGEPKRPRQGAQLPDYG